MKKWLIILISAVLFLILIISLYFHSLTSVRIESVKVDKLRDISLQGFTLAGEIDLFNGGLLPVKVSKISYEVVLESTGEQLARADIKGGWIAPRKIERYGFETTIYWKATKDVILNLLREGRTYAQIRGVAYVGGMEIPFMREVDLEEYLKQFVQEKLGKVVGAVIDIAKKYI